MQIAIDFLMQKLYFFKLNLNFFVKNLNPLKFKIFFHLLILLKFENIMYFFF